MKKLTTLSILFISLAFVVPMQASAATNAGVKPGSFFYFFDTASENINLFFTFNPEQKAKKALEYADERLAEIEAIAEEKNPGAVKTAIINYKSNIALATEKSKEVKDKGQAESLFASIADNASKNQEVLSAVLIKVPEEAKAAITQAIEASKKGQEEATKQIAELKGEIEKLKNEVTELKAKETKVETNTQANEVEKLKKEVEALKKQSATQPAPKQSTPSQDQTKGSEPHATEQPVQGGAVYPNSPAQSNLPSQQAMEITLTKMLRQQCYDAYPTRTQIQTNIDKISGNQAQKAKERQELISKIEREISVMENSTDSLTNSRKAFGTQDAFIADMREIKYQELNTFDTYWDSLHPIIGDTNLSKSREEMCNF